MKYMKKAFCSQSALSSVSFMYFIGFMISC